MFYAAAEGELFMQKTGAQSVVPITLDTSVGNDSQHRGSVLVEATSYDFSFGARDYVWVHLEFLPQAATIGGTDTPFFSLSDASGNYIVRLVDDYATLTTNDVDVQINDGSNTQLNTTSFRTTASTFHAADIFVDYTDSNTVSVRVLFDGIGYVNYTAVNTGNFGKPSQVIFSDRSSTTSEDRMWYRDVIISDFPTIGWKLCYLDASAPGTFDDALYTTITDANFNTSSIVGLDTDMAVSWILSEPTIPSGYSPYGLAVTALTYSEDITTYSNMGIFLYEDGDEISLAFTDYTENQSWHVFTALYTENINTFTWTETLYGVAEIGVKNAN